MLRLIRLAPPPTGSTSILVPERPDGWIGQHVPWANAVTFVEVHLVLNRRAHHPVVRFGITW
jgi:hypothetical protein